MTRHFLGKERRVYLACASDQVTANQDRIENKEITFMLTHLVAALGVGLITAVATPAAAQVAYAPAYPGSAYPGSAYPGSTYPGYAVPAPTAPGVPTYAPLPRRAPTAPRRAAADPVGALRWADYNRDGGVTFAEARAYGQARFRQEDLDRNGVLTRRELTSADDELARDGRRHDGVVTFAEYDTSLCNRFYGLDLDRNGFLSSYELGTNSPRSDGVSFSWHWQL
jgi:hypothetical protein